MKYTKPVVIAQSKKSGSYAAGCPANNRNTILNRYNCENCDRTA